MLGRSVRPSADTTLRSPCVSSAASSRTIHLTQRDIVRGELSSDRSRRGQLTIGEVQRNGCTTSSDLLTCSQEVAYECDEHRSYRKERRPAGAAGTGLAGADGRREVWAVVRRRARRPA